MFVRLDNARDLLSDALFEARLGGVLMSRSQLRPPFALAFAEDAVRPGLHIVLEGSCWIVVTGRPPHRLGKGDFVLLPHGSAHRLCDDPATPPVAAAELARDLPAGGTLQLPFGNAGPETVVMCCAYDIGITAFPIRHGLPALIHVPAGRAERSALPALLEAMQDETLSGRPGAALAQSRLVDLVFVHALRLWLEDPNGSADCWIGAAASPAIGPVLDAIHARPGRDWDIAALARMAGQSRAVFCRKFREATGEPPMAYLARLRMAEAAHLLAGGARIAEAAAAVGYGNEFAFAKAFKRIRGTAPGTLRRKS